MKYFILNPVLKRGGTIYHKEFIVAKVDDAISSIVISLYEITNTQDKLIVIEHLPDSKIYSKYISKYKYKSPSHIDCTFNTLGAAIIYKATRLKTIKDDYLNKIKSLQEKIEKLDLNNIEVILENIATEYPEEFI